MTLPVLYSTFEISDCLHILSSSLGFVDLVRDTFSGCTSFLKFVIVGIVGGKCSFQKGLTGVWSAGDTGEYTIAYLEQERIFTNPLNRFDEKSWELGFRVDQMIMVLAEAVRLY